MTTLPPDLEALMPEPCGYLTDWPAIDGGRRKLFGPTRTAGDALAFKVDPLFTADQVRAAILAATERAAKVAEDTDVVDVQGPNSYYCQLGDAAATRDACAAAIRGGGGA